VVTDHRIELIDLAAPTPQNFNQGLFVISKTKRPPMMMAAAALFH